MKTYLFFEIGRFTVTPIKSRGNSRGLEDRSKAQRAAEAQRLEIRFGANQFYEIESCRRCSFFTKSQAFVPVTRIQPFQGDLHSPEMSTAMRDPAITMDLQFHLAQPRLFAK